MISIKRSQKGFTILELMIATSVFSVVLLLCTFGMMYIGRIYYKGITSSRTQAVARTISEDVVQAVQYGSLSVNTVTMPVVDPLSVYGRPQEVYVGNRHYMYTLGKVLQAGDSVMQVETVDGNRAPVAGTKKELLNTGMWLSKFEVKPAGSAYAVVVQVISGETDQVQDANKKPLTDRNFNLDTLRCTPEAGSQFCAVSGLYAEAVRRL